ncbi:SMP-30/gluconolactonase/LRE family protein [Hydromonas duriensis]|uniref:Sugar lactone lactonase YvrE n=1 Tax=Hydromonas duriensis TaxID=1527608 RepID=A0A4R6YAE1_9BURK|nr:SMP-30/gluconolactonase/LRE family protein [Hydromonas duriensis]TDR32495.1 sugar lactone lactonase YvrE [Hydromonas duriensis]
MKKNLMLAVLTASFMWSSGVGFAKEATAPQMHMPVIQGDISDLPGVESIVFDKKSNAYFASLQAGSTVGDGSIVMISADAKKVIKTVATGLNDPKGITIVGNQLYVGDLSQLVQVDLTTGVVTKHSPEGAQFLNDTVADSQGRIYVSDMFTSAIYRLEHGKVTLWMQSAELENPNGLLFVKGDLYVAAWGRFTDGKPLNATQGRLLKVNPKTKVITPVTAQALGNLDGLQLDGKGNFIVSDWKKAAVYSITPVGVVTQLLSLPQGAGDVFYSAQKKLLMVPMSREGKVRRYTW